MLPRRTTTALTALLTGAVLAGAPSAAHAETWSHRDATGDVVTISDPDETVRPAPANRSADIRRVTVSHTAKRVRVVVRVRDMQRGIQSSQILVKTPSGDLALASLFRLGGRTELYVSAISDDPESEEECQGATGGFRPRQDHLVLAVPRQCLGEPGWVRVTAIHVAADGRGREEAAVDDGLRDRPYGTGHGPGWSPRIHVG